MSFLWDSNILRHYLEGHPRLLENLKKVSRETVSLPVIVVAEQLRGRAEAMLKAEPAQLVRAQELLRQTQAVLSKFPILYFDQPALAAVEQFKSHVKTRKRYADVLIAAQTPCRTTHFSDTQYGRFSGPLTAGANSKLGRRRNSVKALSPLPR